MTWNELATNLAAKMGKPFDLSLRGQLIDDIRNWRSRLLKDSLERHPQDAPLFYQTIYTKLEVNTLPSCIPAGVVCTTYRTVLDIPMPLRGFSFDYVGAIDGRKPYRSIQGSTGTFLMGGKFASLLRFYDYFPDQEKIVTLTNPRILQIRSIFDDPAKVVSCDTEGGVIDCNPWDKEIPASGDVLQKIQEYMLKMASPEFQKTEEENERKTQNP